MEDEAREKCLVCGKETAPEAGVRECYEGRPCVFCSLECQAKLEDDPAAYLGEEARCLVQPPGYW